jgi:hypothetical protein
MRGAIVEMSFVDGPKQGDKLMMSNPPPRFVKSAMPEWAVYETDFVTPTYRVVYEGITARAWRNPVRPSFLAPSDA